MSVYGRSKMGRFMLIGGMVGCALSLLSRETRTVWGHNLSTAASGSGKLIQTIYRHPNQVGRYMQVTGTRLKGVARELSEDFQQMIDHAEKARTSTTNTYQYVMEAGAEITEMAEKIRHAGQSITRFQEPVLVDTEEDALQRLENETSVPNPGTMPRQSFEKSTKPAQSKPKNDFSSMSKSRSK
ncbi:hypothetical protein [Sporolactobacillus putidus]|uniref:Uncharacterized protein n=1 Tax=Sporolactobacillus putidus TaxID=492735 RepID=A0A917S8Q7_9BACL|nr:hypothetical protein [Sporolactobacillus putidus]GGL64683.1 hypothetical protein GCM10007968_30800 [Sporolactobacillus putidus]